jgi:hypothetical protein
MRDGSFRTATQCHAQLTHTPSNRASQPSGEAYKMLTVHSMDGTVRRSIAVDRPYVCLLPSGMVAGIIDGRANIWDIKTGNHADSL